MSSLRGVDPVTRVLHRLSRAGPPGAELAVRLDLVRELGPKRAWRRLRESGGRSSATGRSGSRYATIWGEAAAAVGAEVVELGSGFLEIRSNGARTTVWNHWVPLDDAVTLKLALDKALMHRRLKEAGLPVPEHVEFRVGDLDAAQGFLDRGAPCIVKPAGSSGGSGTTGAIRTSSQLARAVVRAARLDSRLLIERQVVGSEYRLLLLDGDLLDTVRRHPPRVVGDGRSSIEDLIAAENDLRRREDERTLLRIDLECMFTLREQGLSLSSVPEAGAVVPVKKVVSQNGVADNETVHDVGEELVADARRAAATVGLRFVGVDVITNDARRSLAAAGGVVLEVNGTPGLHYHYEVAEPANATQVAVPVLRKLLS